MRLKRSHVCTILQGNGRTCFGNVGILISSTLRCTQQTRVFAREICRVACGRIGQMPRALLLANNAENPTKERRCSILHRQTEGKTGPRSVSPTFTVVF